MNWLALIGLAAFVALGVLFGVWWVAVALLEDDRDPGNKK